VRTIWIVDAHRDNGKRFVVRADEKLAAFVELEDAICGRGNKRPPGCPPIRPVLFVNIVLALLLVQKADH